VREGVPADKIDDKAIRRHLYWPDMPDPDLVVRTSGEHRISNFLLWELAYSELVFPDVLWPDFRRAISTTRWSSSSSATAATAASSRDGHPVRRGRGLVLLALLCLLAAAGFTTVIARS